jgi:hypothetical protein
MPQALTRLGSGGSTAMDDKTRSREIAVRASTHLCGNVVERSRPRLRCRLIVGVNAQARAPAFHKSDNPYTSVLGG